MRFNDYLNLVRVNRAKFMLQNYNMTLKEIAGQLLLQRPGILLPGLQEGLQSYAYRVPGQQYYPGIPVSGK